MWSANQLRLVLLSRSKNDKMLSELNEDGEAFRESDDIKQRFSEAMNILRRSSKGKKAYVYELPWYIIIGPPGSGKTTALLNSGLEFPLEDKLGAEALKGIGGTKNCDWWFTSEAVMIDTAGRFTTQDSHEKADKNAWNSFMQMLKKYRKQQPINGALVAVSVNDLQTLSDSELSFYAKTIRKRIDELRDSLKLNFPIYFMFTKCDLVSGFNEYFNSFEEEKREQVWGDTFELPLDMKYEFDQEEYRKKYDVLIERLKQRLLFSLNRERDSNIKAAQIAFPGQMASLGISVSTFLAEVFSSNRFKDAVLLRGVYFTSGTQEGTPFDRLLGNMTQDLGFSTDSDDLSYSGRGKSYFLKDLLKEVIFTESNIAGVNMSFVKLKKRLYYLGLSSATTMFLGVSILWGLSYQENLQKIRFADEFLSKNQEITLKENNSALNFSSALKELSPLESATSLYDSSNMTYYLGLNQTSVFDTTTHSTYKAALETRLLPLIQQRLEALLIESSHQNDVSLLYDLLKLYLMYAGINQNFDVEFDRELALSIFDAEWSLTFPGDKEKLSALNRHHHYLLNTGFSPIKADVRIVQYARNILNRVPLSNKIYLNLKQTKLSHGSNNLSFKELSGSYGEQVFKSRSGKELSDLNIPSFFTKSGFYNEFLISIPEATDSFLANDWVLNDKLEQSESKGREKLYAEIHNYYYEDFINTWREFLNDLVIRGFSGIDDGVYLVEQATAFNGPIESLVNSIAEKTDLSSPLSRGTEGQAVSEAVGVVDARAQQLANRINRLSRAADKAGMKVSLGKPVTDYFMPYQKLGFSEAGESSISITMEHGRNLSQYINQILFDSFSETSAHESVVKRLSNSTRDEFRRFRVSRSAGSTNANEWINSLSKVAWSLVLSKAKQEINLIWKNEILAYYDSALRGRYPFAKNTSLETELRDFSDFFMPSGKIDNFYRRYISPYVDTKGYEWRLKDLDGSNLDISSEALKQMQLLQTVTKVFFERQSNQPSITLLFTPVSLSRDVTQFRFSESGQSLSYAHGPIRTNRIEWPTIEETGSRYEFQFRDGRVFSGQESGPWSLFKMLDQFSIMPTNQKSTFQISFEEESARATYEVRANSEFNPFGERLLGSLVVPREL